MASAVLSDEALKKLFADGQTRLYGLSRQLNSCKSEIFQRDRNIRMTAVTLDELSMLEKQRETSLETFKSVGKMYDILLIFLIIC